MFLFDAKVIKGPTTCVSGSTCTVSNPYYSQCLPGASSTPVTPTPTSTPPSYPTPPSSTGFVKVSGQKFTLNGADYVVAGYAASCSLFSMIFLIQFLDFSTNAYWLAQNTNADIDKAFADIAAAGLTTVRTWVCFNVLPQWNIYILIICMSGIQRSHCVSRVRCLVTYTKLATLSLFWKTTELRSILPPLDQWNAYREHWRQWSGQIRLRRIVRKSTWTPSDRHPHQQLERLRRNGCLRFPAQPRRHTRLILYKPEDHHCLPELHPGVFFFFFSCSKYIHSVKRHLMQHYRHG